MAENDPDGESGTIETTFEEADVPDYQEWGTAFEGTHERGDRRVVRTFKVYDEEVVVDALYHLGGSRLDGIREGTVEVEEAERRDGSVEAFCRRWHERDPGKQLGEDFDGVIDRNREKPWVRRYVERGR